MNLDRTRAAVLGLGTSGEAAARLLHRRGASVTVFDSGKPDAQKIRTLQDLGISVVTGEAADIAKADYELTILSPGIDPVVPLVQNFRRQGAVFDRRTRAGIPFLRATGYRHHRHKRQDDDHPVD